jgi:hypothetical protein
LRIVALTSTVTCRSLIGAADCATKRAAVVEIHRQIFLNRGLDQARDTPGVERLIRRDRHLVGQPDDDVRKAGLA